MSLTFGRKVFFGTFPYKDGHVGWWTNHTASRPWTQEELKDTTDVVPNALRMLDRTHFPARELVQESFLLLKVNVFDIQSLPTWHNAKRTLLIGDAAHAVSPNSGQGVSMAIEDASLLALLLTRMPSDPGHIFAKFENMRKPRVEKIIAKGRRQKNNKTEVGPIGEFIRNLVLRIVFRFFGVDKALGSEYRYRIDWDEEDIDKCLKEYHK